MKKIILPLLCFFVSAAAYGDDYTTTTILNNPVGVFDNLTVTGKSNLGTVEIGARPKDATSPIAQTQTLTVYGTTELLPSKGTKINVGGSLYLRGGDGSQYAFNNVYIYKNSLLYLSSGSSGASLLADEIDAKTFTTFSSFTEGTTSGSESLLTIAAGTPFSAGTLKFTDGTNVKIMESPREHGSKGVWVDAGGGDTADSYGAWSPLIPSGSEPGDDCTISSPSSGDKRGEFLCPSDFKHGVNGAASSCTDVRLSGIEREYYSTKGGVYFSQARARKDCVYISNTDKCEWESTYTYTDLSGSSASANDANKCPFSAAEANAIISASPGTGRGLGYLCHELCKSPTNLLGECSGYSSCTLTDDNISPLKSGTSGQPGVANCEKSGWPANSGLECKNAWEEKSIRVLHCDGGSGKKYKVGNYYQSRTVICNTGGTANPSPGTFLTLDYDR